METNSKNTHVSKFSPETQRLIKELEIFKQRELDRISKLEITTDK